MARPHILARQTRDLLRSLPWLSAYTFECDNSAVTARDGDWTTEFTCPYEDRYEWVFAQSHPFAIVIKVLISRLGHETHAGYVEWCARRFGFNVTWMEPEKENAIISRGIFAELILLKDTSMIWQSTQDINIWWLFDEMESLLKFPSENCNLVEGPITEDHAKIEAKYRDEFPLLCEKYPRVHYSYVMDELWITIAGIAYRHINYSSTWMWNHFKRLECCIGVSKAVAQLPQPIAEEIAPHLL